MKAKEQARKESEDLSLIELDLDDIGFSGPLAHKNGGDAVFSDSLDNDIEGLEQAYVPTATEVKRASSYSSLNGVEVRSLLYSTDSVSYSGFVATSYTLNHNIHNHNHSFCFNFGNH